MAASCGADDAVIGHSHGLVDASRVTADVVARLRSASAALVPRTPLERWVVAVVGWLLSVASALLLGASVLAREYGHGPTTVGVIGRYSNSPTAARPRASC